METPPRAAARVRREPPRFRRVTVRRAEPVGPRAIHVELAGPELEGFRVEQPAASVRLLLPAPGAAELVIPDWNGNEFLLPGGRRPVIRTFTPLRAEPPEGDPALAVEVVVHGEGAASAWATGAAPGTPAAVSGPGRGYTVESSAPAFLLAGDETAVPAIGQLLAAIPPATPVDVHVEAAAPDARRPLPDHPRARITWHDLAAGAPPGDALVAAVRAAAIPAEARVWVAGEAAAVQRVRRHLFEDRGLPRASCTVRGYWKHGRRGDEDPGDAS